MTSAVAAVAAVAAVECSPLQFAIDALIVVHGARAHEILDLMLDGCGTLELAAAGYDWDRLWARPKQLIPDDFLSHGILTGRMFGKTLSRACYVVREVMAGRVRRVACVAQNEEQTFKVMVDGPTGLIAQSPPWCKPVWERERLVWPNGAQAFTYTPEAPDAMRGPEHDLAWASELAFWPKTTRTEAFSNLRLMTRAGAARLIWDSTPRRRDPLLVYLLERSRRNPRHMVIHGSSRENAANLPREQLNDMIAELAGTWRGREEIEGEMIDTIDGALWQGQWIRRVPLPDALVSRMIGVDPAITYGDESDPTGIVEIGRMKDGRIIVLGDYSDRLPPEQWARLIVNKYLVGKCTLVCVETNRGGALVIAMLRAEARSRNMSVRELQPGQTPPAHNDKIICVLGVHARGAKETRAEPVAAMYELGKVVHAEGADLQDLENEMTSWEPPAANSRKAQSPNRIDALVHGVWQLAQLGRDLPDGAAGFVGIAEVQKVLTQPAHLSPGVMGLLLRGRGGNSL